MMSDWRCTHCASNPLESIKEVWKKGKEMITEELDALSLEYKRDYGTAYKSLNIADVANNPDVFGPSDSEKIQERRIKWIKFGCG